MLPVPAQKMFRHLCQCHCLCILVLCGIALSGISASYASTPAGTVIKNQASASYRDSDGVLRFATSNVVETLIQQVAAVQLAQDQSKPVVAGRQVFLSHTLTNTGNGPDLFDISVTNAASGDTMDLSALLIYADNNQDGQPDVYTPLTVSPTLAMQESFSFVVAGQVAPAATAGQSAIIQVVAASQFNASVSAANSDTVVVMDGAVVEVDKSISVNVGNSPDGPFSITLNYRNIGTDDAVDVTLIDALPTGMTYVAGSGRWSGTGSVVLTDDNAADMQGSPETIRYCAYFGSCGGLPEAGVDADNDSTNQVTAIISTVPAGASGVLTFEVEIAANLNTTVLHNTAELEYTSNTVVSSRILSNSVAFQVLHQPSVVLNGSVSNPVDGDGEPQVVSVIGQGSSVIFENTVWNTGNGTDTFDLQIDNAAATFPSGSIFRLLQSDGMTPLLDTTGNGMPDTGPLPAGGSYTVKLQVIPPAASVGDNSGAGYQVELTAVSDTDSAVSNPMTNRLLNISSASVDITNTAEIGDVTATGQGAGPEPDPVTTVTVLPGATATIGLFINNTGQTAVGVDLAVSTASDFSTLTLPDGWAVTFQVDGENNDTTTSGLINPGEFVLVNALVTVPVDETEGDVSLYFRAWSELTGAIDIKHDRITVSLVQQLLLELDQNGQASAGGSKVYHHVLQNTGNGPLSNIELATTDSEAGWSSILYEDTNNNGELDGADQVVTSVANLAAGENRRLFVKVFVPTGASALVTNQTVVTASYNAGADSVQATDITTVVTIEINIVKEQAPDYGCTGSLDGSYGVGGFSVEPGNNCVSYRLTATNAGLSTAYNVDVADATPAFTAYFGSAICSSASCTVSEPVDGGQGSVVASVPELAAGDIVTLRFSVRVE